MCWASSGMRRGSRRIRAACSICLFWSGVGHLALLSAWLSSLLIDLLGCLAPLVAK